MSKKKNTLKDLDEFLKQQAATIVAPAKLSDKIEDISGTGQPQVVTEALPELQSIIEELTRLSGKAHTGFRNTLYDLILHSVECQPEKQPEDAVLINTILYLKSGDHWRDVIRQYWRNRFEAGTLP